MMTQNNMLDWGQLSMRQRAAFIRNAVSRGKFNMDDIIQDYNEFRKGGPMEGRVYNDLPKMLKEAGLDIKVTSGYRPVGTGNAGQRSWHHRHGAVDIIPQGNTTFEDIENVLHNNPVIRQYMLSHNFGLIDESGRTAESRDTMRKTGATGAHFHIGKDSKYADLYRQRVGALQEQRPQSPEEILQNVTIPAPIGMDEDIQASVELPEVVVTGHRPKINPIELLAQIQESAPAPLALEPYQIPQIQNTVADVANQRNTFLQKDLEDRLLAEERRRRLGYSYRDDSVEDDIKQMYFLRNMSANGGNLYGLGGDTVKELVDAIYQNNLREEYLGEPVHHYDFTQSEEWANAHGYYPDARGHRDDRVKKPAHPSHPSRGIWDGDKFILTEVGIQNPNYTLFGLNDGGQDPQATLIYDNGVVLPEFTVTPKGNYIENPYDNIRIHYYGGGGGLMPIINIPAVAKNLYNKAKDRLYRTITPQGYHLGKAAKEFIKGDTRDFSKFAPAENEVWARYLGVPYEGESSFEKAIYTPTKGGATYDDVIKFKDESQILSDDVLRQLLMNQMETGKNTMLVEGNESGLGTYTVSLGEDEKGKYISYYDDWDINPTRGLSAKFKIPLIEQIGDVVPGSNPFTIYGRRYYTDEDLRRVIER